MPFKSLLSGRQACAEGLLPSEPFFWLELLPLAM